MLKKTISYKNLFTDELVTEDHYFHISKADLVEMEMEEHKDEYTNKTGETLTGMQAKLQRIVDSEDGKAIMAELKDIIRRAYGKKDGTRFLKSSEIWEEFAATEAFSQMLFELCTDAKMAAEFINGVVPGDLEMIAEEVRVKAENLAQETSTEQPVEALAETNGDPTGLSEPSTPQVLTTAEATAMDAQELQSGLVDGRYKLS